MTLDDVTNVTCRFIVISASLVPITNKTVFSGFFFPSDSRWRSYLPPILLYSYKAEVTAAPSISAAADKKRVARLKGIFTTATFRSVERVVIQHSHSNKNRRVWMFVSRLFCNNKHRIANIKGNETWMITLMSASSQNIWKFNFDILVSAWRKKIESKIKKERKQTKGCRPVKRHFSCARAPPSFLFFSKQSCKLLYAGRRRNGCAVRHPGFCSSRRMQLCFHCYPSSLRPSARQSHPALLSRTTTRNNLGVRVWCGRSWFYCPPSIPYKIASVRSQWSVLPSHFRSCPWSMRETKKNTFKRVSEF